MILFLAFTLLLTQAVSGPLRDKAVEYDRWNVLHHHPFYGGILGVLFSDEAHTVPVDYRDTEDSCIWTGTYLGSQAFRYMVTHEETAKENIKATVKTLHRFLRVTGKKGYIARFTAINTAVTHNDCKRSGKCREVTSGEFKGDYWEGNTSKDQYSGWFFGMILAYEALGDVEVETKKLIKDDIVEVVDQLISDSWIIVDEKGEYALSAAPRPTFFYQLSWLTIAYRVTGDKKYLDDALSRFTWFAERREEFDSYESYLNRYAQYYGNNLAHLTWYNLLRLARIYYPASDLAWLREFFVTKVHVILGLSHNPWFSAIYATQARNSSENVDSDPYMQQIRQDLGDFRPCPNVDYALPARDRRTYKMDQVTSWLSYFPTLRRLLNKVEMDFEPQAKEAFPILLQCPYRFLFERTPFTVEACGNGNKRLVQPGHDYLVAYWLASYHQLIKPED